MAFLGSHRPRFSWTAVALSLGFFAAVSFAPQEAFAQASVAASAPHRAVAVSGPIQQSMPVVTGAQLSVRGGRTDLKFRISKPSLAQAYVLANPDRVVVDLPEVNFQISPDLGRPSRDAEPGKASQDGVGRGADSVVGGIIGSFRFGLFAPGKSRIVIDLVQPARIVRAGMEPTASGASELVVDLARTDETSFKAAAAAAVMAEPVAAPALIPAPAAKPGGLPVVVLDPGHGGVDPGALGPHGIEEKQITLAFAKTLAAKLSADGQVKVVLTRTRDIFVPLSERVAIARQAGASLFLSIHADTLSDSAHVSGATIYTESNKASDADAAREARRENQADAAGGLESEHVEGEVANILFDLARRETLGYSNVFARVFVKDWRHVAPLNKNAHRSAGFVVLKAPDVPSALLELGYLSSNKDVSHLTDPKWRDMAAAAVARAIETFFAKNPHGAPLASPVEAASVASSLHK